VALGDGAATTMPRGMTSRERQSAVSDPTTSGSEGDSVAALRIRARRLLKLFWIAGLSPLALLIAFALMPESALMSLARVFNELLWVHFKHVQIDGCTSKCHMVAYSLVGIPISLFAALVAGIWSIPLAIQNWQASQEALGRGANPYGRLASGKPIASPLTGVFAWSVAFAGMVLAFAVLAGCVWVLYLLAGSDRTISRGREIYPAIISIYTTAAMGITQLVAAVSFAIVTLLMCHLKKLLRR
jgi:hypothetical protein